MAVPLAGEVVLTSAKAILASAVRTLVPFLVGVIIKALSHIQVVADTASVEALVNGLISVGFALAYYGIARVLEVFQSSKFGWLLGYAKAAPVYVAPAKAANQVQPDAAAN